MPFRALVNILTENNSLNKIFKKTFNYPLLKVDSPKKKPCPAIGFNPQFPFQTEKQLTIFEHNYNSKLYYISKFILTKTFWKNLKLENIRQYDITKLRQNIDYYEYSKKHPVGIGYELLALNKTNKRSLTSIRNTIADKIILGKSDFNSVFQIDRSINLFSPHRYFLAALIILKAHSEHDLKLKLLNSSDQSTLLTISHENINTLAELLHYNDYQIL